MEITYDKTRNGGDRCVIVFDKGIVSTGYPIDKKYQFNIKKERGLCSLSKDEIDVVFEKANEIANYNGDYIEYLKSFKQRRGRDSNQTVTSNDGLYKFQYYFKKDKGIIICAVHNKRERRIRPVLPFEDEEKAKEIISEIKKEYDSTGKFKSYRKSLRGTPFLHEVLNDNDSKNMELDISYYESITSYILNGFDNKGDSQLNSSETLIIYCVDGFEIELEDTDSLRTNENKDIVIIHTCEAPDNELVIPVDKISRVLLSRE